jgi:hypothetical protein
MLGAVLVSTITFFNRRMEQLAALAARHALHTIFPYREYVLAGSLMSYGSPRLCVSPSWHLYRTHSQDAMGRQRGAYIHRCIERSDGAPS